MAKASSDGRSSSSFTPPLRAGYKPVLAFAETAERTMSFETITYEKTPPLAVVTLNRPDKLNALSETLQSEVREALHDAGFAVVGRLELR